MNTNHSGDMIEEILALAKNLIAIRSTENNKTGLEEIISLVGSQLPGYTIQQFSSNNKPSLLIHTTKLGTKHFKIILNAHLDVVPGEKRQFMPSIKNNKLFGRGAFDMKGASAAMILLFREIAKKIDYPLAIQLVTDEEIGGHNGTKYQIEKGITSDFVIAGEFSGYEIKNKSKSVLWLKIKTYGTAAHAAYLWRGENALLNMYSILKKIEKLYPTPTTQSWKTTVNVAKVETPNDTFNRVPDECTAWLDIRAISEDEEYILERIKKVIPKNAELEIVIREKGAYTDQNNPFITSLQKIIKTFEKDGGEITGANGTSDIRFYNTMIHVPGVEFGPIGAGAHSDEEYVDIKSLETYYQILKNFLLSIK